MPKQTFILKIVTEYKLVVEYPDGELIEALGAAVVRAHEHGQVQLSFLRPTSGRGELTPIDSKACVSMMTSGGLHVSRVHTKE